MSEGLNNTAYLWSDGIYRTMPESPSSNTSEIAIVTAQRDKLAEALRNYSDTDFYVSFYHEMSDAELDRGEIARKALAELEKETAE